MSHHSLDQLIFQRLLGFYLRVRQKQASASRVRFFDPPLPLPKLEPKSQPCFNISLVTAVKLREVPRIKKITH